MSPSSDGRQAAIEEREKDRDIDQASMAQAAQEGDVEQLRELIKSELHPGTVRVLDNYLSRDFILGKATSNDVEAFQWRVRRRVKWAIWRHPPRGGLTGLDRAVAYDDADADLPALSHEEHLIINAYADGIIERYRRSEEGFQQTEMRKQRNVLERINNNQEEGGRIAGLF